MYRSEEEPAINSDLVNILLVDDRPENLLALEAVLAPLGQNLVRASSGEEALKRVLGADFAVVLLDVKMPGLSGFEVAKLVRARERSRHTPIIFLSADASDDFPMEEAYALGAVDYLVKPFGPVALRAKVGVFVELACRTRQAREADRLRLWQTTLVSIGDAVIATDTGGRVTFINPVAERLTGWSLGDARGAPLAAVFRIVNETTREPVENPAFRALETGVVVGLANHTVLIARDGTERPIDDSAAPIRDDRGEVSGAVLVFRDISERKAAEAELARVTAESDRQRRLYETVLSATPDFVYVFGLDHTVLYANDALIAMWGRGREGAIGKTFLEIGYPAWHAEMHGREIDTVRATKQPVRGEVPFTGTLGRRIYDYIFVPVFGADGEVEAVAGTTRDVTDRKAGEEKLRLLDAVGEAVRPAAEPVTVLAATTRLLGQHLGATRVAYADLEPDNDRFTIRSDWTAEGAKSTIGTYSLDTFGPRAAADMRAGRTLVVRDVDAELSPAGGADTFNAIGIKAIVCCPLVKGGRLVAMMAAHQAAPRDWSPGEVALVEEVVERSWAHVERIGAAAAVRASEEQYRTLFESIDEGFCVAEVLFDGGRAVDYRFLTVNPVFETQTGLRDAIGKRMRELAPDHDEHWFEIYGAVAATGTPARFQNYAEALGRHFDVYAFRTGAPEARRVAMLFRDVTARKRTEEAVQFLADASSSLAELVDYQSTLNRIANLAVAGFADWCVVDMIGDGGQRERLAVTATEAAVVTGARAEDAAFYPADGVIGVVPHVLSTGEPEVVYDLNETVPSSAPQGPERLAKLRALGIRSYLCVPLRSRGRVIGSMTFLASSARRRFGLEELRVAQNLAERVTVAIENAQLYRTLQEQDRRKDEFLATLAHELRNPLAPVRNGLQILRMGGATGGSAGRALTMMERQLGQITHLVDDLMDVARVSSGKVVLRRERLPLRVAVDAAVETSRPAVEAGGHELALRLPGEALVLDVDRTRLVQVLANLLNNAAKYTPHGGRIVLSAGKDGGFVAVQVADTGVGIPADMLPKVFEMFTQVGTSLERSQGGLGIGLTLVKRLVEMHGGAVKAESPGPGRGSTFTVRLPLAADAAAPANARTERDGPAAGHPLDILVVDDNRDAADSLAVILEMGGHRVTTAHDGPQALKVLAAFRPQLVLLDLGLPGMSGYEVARRIRDSEELGGVTLAALTGWGQEEDRRRTREGGFDHHLTKPADPAELERIVAEVQAKG